ncbi:MAG TPA: OpgC domain-containing protein, partial [Acetobacteraceae bacterium]|nr:OpgC domain-containing protein [Acetobacteraceae bacterium]
YCLMRITGYNLPSWTSDRWYFNPIAWQFLFIIGAVLSYARPRLPGPPRLYDVLAGVSIITGLLLLWLVWPYPEIESRMPALAARVLLSVDKEGLHPMRLFSILALAWAVYRLIPAGAPWLRSWTAKPFVLCGQHSLAVFCAGIFLSFLGRLAMEEQPNWIVTAGVNLLGSAALVGVGALAAWYRYKGAARGTGLSAAEPAGNAEVA